MRARSGRRGVRCSDAEREQAVRALRGAYAEGRLETDELEERIARAHAAQWRAELAALGADLPRFSRGRGKAIARRVDRAALHAHAVGYAALNGSLVGIWELAGGGAFWPAVSLVPGTVLLGWHVAASRALRRRLGAGRGHRRLSAG